jgi:hypothetical protein
VCGRVVVSSHHKHATMELDLQLVRALLAQIDRQPQRDNFIDLSIAGYDVENVSNHVRLLDGLGYVNAKAVWTSQGEVWKSVTITWIGADFLTRARDDVAWERAKELIKRGVVSDPQVELEVFRRLLHVCAGESSRPDNPPS